MARAHASAGRTVAWTVAAFTPPHADQISPENGPRPPYASAPATSQQPPWRPHAYIVPPLNAPTPDAGCHGPSQTNSNLRYEFPAPRPHERNSPPSYQTPMHSGPPTYLTIRGGARPRKMRAIQACEQCRQRKQKCDEGSPCSFCKENSLPCQYRDGLPAKADKNMEKLLSYVEAHSAGLQELADKMDSFEAWVGGVEHNSRLESENNSTNVGTVQDSHSSDDGDVVPWDRESEWDDHCTAPHDVLLWPSVRSLLRAADVKYDDEYVRKAEDRGVLRLWSYGEDSGTELNGTQAGVPSRSDESGQAAAARSPVHGIWGDGPPWSDVRPCEPRAAGGPGQSGAIDLDAGTINTLYRSYMDSFHVMHPVFDEIRLRKWVDSFIIRYSPDSHRAADHRKGSRRSDERAPKRQKSNDWSANVETGRAGKARRGHHRAPYLEQSAHNAVVCLVLALGEIGRWTDPLPAVVGDGWASPQVDEGRGFSARSPSCTDTESSCATSSSRPPAWPSSSGEGALPSYGSHSHRPSVGVPPGATPGTRNMDIIPGLAYYGRAVNMLGEQSDGDKLLHAQMFLLAGLYKGQLARVGESMSWVTKAGRVVIGLLDRQAPTDVRTQEERACIMLTAWACVQLESDILAGLKLPPSGILDRESFLFLPQNMLESKRDLHLFSAHLLLHKHRNTVREQSCGEACVNEQLSAVGAMLLGHERIFEGWRAGLPPTLSWKNGDSPPQDIRAARLRGEYWGARHVTNRPFLHYALHMEPLVEGGSTVESAATDGHGGPRRKGDVHLLEAMKTLGNVEIREAARRCIETGMESAAAFDNVPGRVIVRNIHGTAHAQFSTVLVLAATWYTEHLHELVDGRRLQTSLQRTVEFLRKLAPISPTCAADCGILEKINDHLFPLSSE